jgi:putative transposase
MLTEDKKLQRRRYEQFVAQDDSEEITSLFHKKKFASIVGSEEFAEWVKEQSFSEKSHKEVPESKSLAPDTERIKEFVYQAY